MPVKIGDMVQVLDREPTQADVKSGLFYNHFRNLTGTVERIYEDSTVCVNVDIASLSREIQDGHSEIASEMRDKWINSLSQEARSRLTEKDKQFRLSYKIIIADSDVLPVKGGTSKKSPTIPKSSVSESESKTPIKPKREAKAMQDTSDTKRPTLEDLDAKEREYLEAKKKKPK